jgi:homospermidine synthase
VACGVLSAVDYILKNPRKGILFPEAIDTEDVFKLVERFLGTRWEWVSFCPKSTQFVDLTAYVLDS